MSIPTTEPARIRAGDTLEWTRSLSEYSAAEGWVLKYRLINAQGKIDIVTTPSGSAHAVSVAATITKTWRAGSYAWQAYAEKGVERRTVATGAVVVDPDLAGAGVGAEVRGIAQQMVEALEAAYLAYTTAGLAVVVRKNIVDREMEFRTAEDFLVQLRYWRMRRQAEELAARVANGLPATGRLQARF